MGERVRVAILGSGNIGTDLMVELLRSQVVELAMAAGLAPVRYAETVATIASRSAGPWTRANIDEFTQTTARGIERVGGAERAKAIIVLHPADSTIVMRDAIYALTGPLDQQAVAASIHE